MGWSCRVDADNTLTKIKTLIESNYKVEFGNGLPNGFYDVNTRIEHIDGAITGSVHKFVGVDRCKKIGSFRIEGNGYIKRFPMLPLFIKKQINQEYKNQ